MQNTCNPDIWFFSISIAEEDVSFNNLCNFYLIFNLFSLIFLFLSIKHFKQLCTYELWKPVTQLIIANFSTQRLIYSLFKLIPKGNKIISSNIPYNNLASSQRFCVSGITLFLIYYTYFLYLFYFSSYTYFLFITRCSIYNWWFPKWAVSSEILLRFNLAILAMNFDRKQCVRKDKCGRYWRKTRASNRYVFCWTIALDVLREVRRWLRISTCVYVHVTRVSLAPRPALDSSIALDDWPPNYSYSSRAPIAIARELPISCTRIDSSAVMRCRNKKEHKKKWKNI